MNYIWDKNNTKTYNNAVGQYKFRKQYAFIEEELKKQPVSRILDIAGGSGRFAIPMLKYCDDITVIDINSQAIQLLNQENKNIKTICNDFITFEFNRKYQILTCIEAIGYFEDMGLFFDKVNDLLEDNGKFIFTITNVKSWRFLFRKIKNMKKGYTRYNEISIKQLYDLLKEKKLEIVKSEGMNWIPLALSSNSYKLVSFFEFIERKLRLNYWINQSPWLLLSIKKTK